MTVALSGFTLHTNNDSEAGWAGTDGPDAYNNAIEGTNSESWQVSKNATETGTLTKSATLDTVRELFLFWMSSNLAPYYTDINLELESTTGNRKSFEVANATNKEIGGVFISSAIDFINKGIETGTFSPAAFSLLRLIVDNSSSGNIRSVINNWIDAMWYGIGHSITGTTVGDKLFDEAASIDDTSKIGGIWNYNDEIFCQVDLSFDGTDLVSDSETLVFVDTLNGYDTYESDGTGTMEFINTFVKGSGAIDYNFDMSGMTAFTMTGGGILGFLTAVFAVGQAMSSVLFQDGGAMTVPNNPVNWTVNKCGQMTLTGTASGTTFNQPVLVASTAAVVVNDLTKVGDADFTRGTNGYAVELTSIGGGSMGWSATLSGYRAGATGSPVTPTNLGDEAIFVNVASGTLTINVAAGATIPSIRSAGATVNVVAGQVTTEIIIKDKDTKVGIEGVAVIVRASDGTGPLPYKESVTITRSGSVATVSHTAHGIDDGKQVEIEGADQNEYNRAKIITVINANSYSFPVSGTPTTPATGTITATGILINGWTNASGIISDTRTLGSDQPISGNAIKGDTDPVYVTSPISDIVDSANGKSISILMIPD